MINIYILTTTRAEYGLMKPMIKRMRDDPEIKIKLLVSGTHLSEDYGYTVQEIMGDNYAEIIKEDILSKRGGVMGTSETMSNAIVKFTELFAKDRPDFLFIDGDRYEALAVAIAAVNSNIPIIHNGGGCTTEGAADEYYRHAITKLSYLHFTSTDEYRRRIIQMGESPERVFQVGSLGIENIMRAELLSKDVLETSLSFKLDKPYAVVTFHPVTLEHTTFEKQAKELLHACLQMEEMRFLITGANADTGGDVLNQLYRDFAGQNRERFLFTESLGMIRYLSALKYSKFVLGNSSSGLIEAPSFHIPTVNIGDRQRGRIQADSIINCRPKAEDIRKAMHLALDRQFQERCRHTVNPNGDGNTSEKIVAAVKSFCNKQGVDIKKSFYYVM